KEKVLHRIVREANELRAKDPSKAHLRAMIQETTCDWCGRDLHTVDDHKIVDPRMDKVAEFYARWFAKKRAPDYSDAEAASEELANDLLGVHESNKRDFWQSCAVKFLRGT